MTARSLGYTMLAVATALFVALFHAEIWAFLKVMFVLAIFYAIGDLIMGLFKGRGGLLLLGTSLFGLGLLLGGGGEDE